jgi:SPP1 gp7 family putative phage head morphogenesis protein
MPDERVLEPLTKAQIKSIKKAATTYKTAIGAVLAKQGKKVIQKASLLEIAKLKAQKNPKIADFKPAKFRGITDRQISNYQNQLLKKGGSDIVEAVKLPNGGIKSVRKFKPWLNDLSIRETEEITNIISSGISEGKYPLKISKELKSHFAGTKHNAVTAARTESQKLRVDAKFNTYREIDIKYVQYITAGDENVRWWHEAKNGKIYKLSNAPELGEPNCRCNLAPADYLVENKGMKPETSNIAYPK